MTYARINKASIRLISTLLQRLAAPLLLAMLLTTTIPATLLGYPAETPKDILLLSSYHAGLEWDDAIKRAVTDVLKPEENWLEIHYEYMDTKRIADPEYLRLLHNLYRHKYRQRAPALIIATDNFAFDFLRKFRDQLFPEVPVVFCGVNFYHDRMLAGHRLFTGAAEIFDAAGTVDIILRLHPGTKEIFVLNDHDLTGRAWDNTIREQLEGRYPGVRFTYAESYTAKGAIERVRGLKPGTVVLLGVFLRDAEGKYISAHRFGDKLSSASQVPVYGLLDLYLGHGILGGLLVDGYHQGELAARIAQRILAGEAPGSIPVIKEGITSSIFDFQQLQRFGIRESALPANSTVINKPTSFYARHKLKIFAGGAFVAGQSILLFFLGLNLLHKRRAEEELCRANSELERRVEERTSELSGANAALTIEIEERKRTEGELAQLMREQQILLDNAPFGISMVVDRKQLWINRKAAELFQYSKEELEGETTRKLYPTQEAYDQLGLDAYQELARGEVFETVQQLVRRDGTPILVRYIGKAVDPPDLSRGTIWLLEDITEQKRLEEMLRLSEETFSKSFHNAPMLMTMSDIETGRYMDVNEAFCRISGFSRAEAVGKTSIELGWISPENRQRMFKLLQEENRIAAMDLDLRKKDGAVIWCQYYGEIIRTSRGEMLLSIAQDVTEQKRIEEELVKLNAELDQRVKTRAADLERLNRELEGFCYAISHELRGPIARLDGYSSVIMECAPNGTPEELSRLAGRIGVASQRLRMVIDGLLQMTRLARADIVHERVNLSNICQHIMGELLEDAGGREIKVVIEADVFVEGDRYMLEVCLKNLLGNATKCTGKSSPAIIEFGQTMLAGGKAYFVRDNGIGFDIMYAGKLFEPFCRLHKESGLDGSGVGLATVQRVIERHGGQIWAEAAPGEGATFYFTLGD